MRVFKFMAGSDAYELGHTALMTAQMKLSLAQYRDAARIIKKWEAHGRVKPQEENGPPNSLKLMTNPKACTIELEEAEFRLFREIVESAPFLPRVAPQLMGLLDLLDNTPEESEKGKPKK